MQDVRLAFRMIQKHPGYAGIVVGTLALALAAVTAVFSAADATLLAPLPVPHADRLVHLFDRQPQYPAPATASWPEVRDWRAHARSLSAVAAERAESFSYLGAAEPERVQGAYVSADYFRVFPVVPVAGRFFSAEEHVKGGPPVVVLGDAFWRRAFGGNPDVLGRDISLNGKAFTVVGVLPSGGLEVVRGRRDVWLPIEPHNAKEVRGDHYLTVFGRLASGETLASAAAELETLGPTLDVDHSGHRIGIRSLREALFGNARPGLVLLFGAALFVLIIAGANVTSLMLARMSARSHELGVRAALGASRSRLGRQLLTESVILALAGGAIGLWLAVWAKDLLLALWPPEVLRPQVVPLAWRSLVFALSGALVVGASVGAVPAFRGSRADLATTFRGGTVPRTGRLRSALVVLQHAVAIVLLAGGALLGQSLFRLLRAKPGFDPAGVATMNVTLPEGRYPDHARRRAFYEAVVERLRALPGVTAASAISNLPFGSSYTSGSFQIEGRPPFPSNDLPQTDKFIVDGEYFHALRIPVLAGRTFSPADRRRLMIVSKTFADRFFPGESPIGERIDAWGGYAEVVGVVGDVRRRTLDEAPEPQMYMNLEQAMPWVTFVVRTSGDPTVLFGAMKAQVFAVDPMQPVHAVGTMDELLARSSAQRRVVASLVGVFAAVALLLAALGVYGVLSHAVSQRTREIGVRMALGARAGSVMTLVLRQGMLLALLGAVLGVGGAFLLAQLVGTFLYGVSASDPLTYLAATAILLAVGAIACFLPARRAARVDPMTALRAE